LYTSAEFRGLVNAKPPISSVAPQSYGILTDMPVPLSAETQALIEERLKRGGYSSADDVVRVALDVLHQVEDEDIDDRDIAEIRQAIEQMKQGQVVDWKSFSQ
jgi:Arc/MetJ-type ribon-helix-helix transcriptional regulator